MVAAVSAAAHRAAKMEIVAMAMEMVVAAKVVVVPTAEVR